MKNLNCNCPMCGGKMRKLNFGYGCSNYNDENIKCNFTIGSIKGKKLSKKEIEDLLNNGITETIKGFTSVSNRKFDAKLKLTIATSVVNNTTIKAPKLEFVFENNNTDTNLICPYCQSRLLEVQKRYFCENNSGCGFAMAKRIKERDITLEEFKELVTNHSVYIEGFKREFGYEFNGYLLLKENETGINLRLAEKK